MKKAFTLAEVLITLVIIGVIAAMTIPTLINNTQNQEFASKLKKTYSTLSNVTNQIIAEEGSPRGDIGGWAASRPNLYNAYKNRLSVMKACGNSGGCVPQLATNGAGSANGFKALNTGNPIINNYETNGNFYKFILADGVQVIFNDGDYLSCNHVERGSTDMCSAIFVDLNGEKGPNTWGRDVYFFALKENGLFPGGCDDTSEAACRKNGNGVGCACRVIRENGIKYL